MCAVDSTLALKVLNKPQYDIVVRCITCVDIDLTAEVTMDHEVGFGLIPKLDDFDLLLCCENHFS